MTEKQIKVSFHLVFKSRLRDDAESDIAQGMTTTHSPNAQVSSCQHLKIPASRCSAPLHLRSQRPSVLSGWLSADLHESATRGQGEKEAGRISGDPAQPGIHHFERIFH